MAGVKAKDFTLTTQTTCRAVSSLPVLTAVASPKRDYDRVEKLRDLQIPRRSSTSCDDLEVKLACKLDIAGVVARCSVCDFPEV